MRYVSPVTGRERERFICRPLWLRYRKKASMITSPAARYAEQPYGNTGRRTTRDLRGRVQCDRKKLWGQIALIFRFDNEKGSPVSWTDELSKMPTRTVLQTGECRVSRKNSAKTLQG